MRASNVIAQLNRELAREETTLTDWSRRHLLNAAPEMTGDVFRVVSANVSCSLLTGSPKSQASVALARQVSTRALGEPTETPPALSLVLARQVRQAAMETADPDFPAARREAAEQSLQLWQSVQAKLGRPPEEMGLFETEFVESQRDVSLPIIPMLASRLTNGSSQLLVSGMAPSSIRDPELRRDYERLLAVERATQIERNEVIWLARDFRTFARETEDSLAVLYARYPIAHHELASLLVRHLTTEQAQDRVGRQVAALLPSSLQSEVFDALRLARREAADRQAKRSVPYADKFKAAIAKAEASKEVGTAGGPTTRADGSHTSGAQAAAVPPSAMPMVVLISTVCAAGLLWLLLRRRGKDSGSARTPVR